MDDYTRSDEHTDAPGRILVVTVLGDTADEIEMAALDAAREFFGPDRQLAVVPDYMVSSIGPADRAEWRETGKRYITCAKVRTVEG